MTNYFDDLYACLRNQNLLLSRIRYYSIMRFAVRQAANIILPVYYRVTSKCKSYSLEKNNGKKEGRLIVSLTSFPLRISRLWLVIETLLRQAHRPDMIILWLSKEQFKTMDCVPHSLLRLQRRGLTICLVDGDIRSHKKYYYTLKQFPGDILVTADDDLLYRTDWLKSLWEKHLAVPKAVICRYGMQIGYDKDGHLEKYTDWKVADTKSDNVFFGSGGGVLFPVASLYKDVTDIELACRLTPLADDVWLNTMVRLARTPIIKVIDGNSILPVINRRDQTLSSENKYNNLNDIQINAVSDFYEDLIGINPYSEVFLI